MVIFYFNKLEDLESGSLHCPPKLRSFSVLLNTQLKLDCRLFFNSFLFELGVVGFAEPTSALLYSVRSDDKLWRLAHVIVNQHKNYLLKL